MVGRTGVPEPGVAAARRTSYSVCLEHTLLDSSRAHYVVVEQLAEGGMGAVYLGNKVGPNGIERKVVLKHLLPAFMSEPRFVDLFLREAALSASLNHPNIVRTTDLVKTGDEYFMVMEYVAGGDLGTLVRRARRRQQRFAPAAAIFIGEALLAALAYAHAKTGRDGAPLGLIHRDVSPANILLSAAGEVKLTDFGIAKVATHESVVYTVRGKVGYMSPEQARNQPLDARSDLFSLAVVLYEVLAGERLFVGSVQSGATLVYRQPVMPPSMLRPELPAALDEVILRALSLDREQRFQSAAEFRRALASVARRHRLVFSAAGMASHLRAICGQDPRSWSQVELDASDWPRRTAVLSGIEDTGEDLAPRPVGRPLPVGELTLVHRFQAPEPQAEPEQDSSDPLEPDQPVPASLLPELSWSASLWAVVFVVVVLALGFGLGIALSGPRPEPPAPSLPLR